MGMKITCLDDAALIELQAVDPERNIARRYVICTASDLFGAIVVELRWGRIGARGTARSLSFERSDLALRFVNAVLARRASARSRIGVDYLSAAEPDRFAH